MEINQNRKEIKEKAGAFQSTKKEKKKRVKNKTKKREEEKKKRKIRERRGYI